MKFKEKNGITLIALVITITVLLILAGISLNALNGENGIINSVISSKEKEEISTEKGIVKMSASQALDEDISNIIYEYTLQKKLDNNAGEGKTNVTEDESFIVKFIETQRVYNVDNDGNVEYLGKENEIVNQATITANPTSNTTPKLTQEVEIIVRTLLSTESTSLNLIYAWNQSEEEMPEETKFVKANLIGETRTKRTNVISVDTIAGDYYLWVKLMIGEETTTKCFGPYTIKDNTTLIACNTESESTSSFLGNANISRNEIEKVVISTSFGTHSLSDDNCWDVSQSQDGKYLAWYEDVDGDNYYEVTIAGNGGVVANANSSKLFNYIGYNGDDNQVIYGIENLDTGLVRSMNAMFQNCRNMKNIDLKSLDTRNVTNLAYMFYGCTSLESLDLRTFKTEKVTTLEGTFQNCTSLKTLYVDNWNTENVSSMGQGNIGIGYGGAFQNCSSLTSLDIGKWNLSKVGCTARMFQGCTNLETLDVSNWNTSNISSLWNMFNGCTNLKELDVSKWNTKKVCGFQSLFENCKALEKIDVSNWNTSSATSMTSMFSGCSNLTQIDVSNFDTSKVTSISWIFSNCSNITNLDVSKWNVEKCGIGGWTFAGCSKLESLDTSNWKATVSGSIWDTFSGCSSLKKLDLSGITVINSGWIQGMVVGCQSLEYLDIRNFDTSTVTRMSWVFRNCTSLKYLNLTKFSMESATEVAYVFNEVPSTVEIITNATMAEWLNTNYPSLTNITIVN